MSPHGRFDQTFSSNKAAFDKILGYVGKAKTAGGEVLIGGTGQYLVTSTDTTVLIRHSGDDSVGYFVQPTVILTKDPKSVTMVEEIFGPVLTVGMMLHNLLLWASRDPRSMSLRTLIMILLST